MKPQIGISEKNLEHVIELLSSGLSNEMTLYIKTRKAHWNVTGESFMELHKLFENQYKQLEESIDEIAVSSVANIANRGSEVSFSWFSANTLFIRSVPP